jgi:hypothetical protein
VDAFRFSLEKALNWRRSQFDAAQAELRLRAAALAAMDRSRAELAAAGVAAEVNLRQRGSIQGLDLSALAAFRSWVRGRERRIGEDRIAAARSLAEQRAATLEARRRHRLLERLRERRLQEWEAAANKEIEDLAMDSALARWQRDRGGRAHPR